MKRFLPLIVIAIICSCTQGRPYMKTGFFDNNKEVMLTDDPECASYLYYRVCFEYPLVVFAGNPVRDSLTAENIRTALLETAIGDEMVEDAIESDAPTNPEEDFIHKVMNRYLADMERDYIKDNLPLWKRYRQENLNLNYSLDVYNAGYYKDFASFVIYCITYEGGTDVDEWECGVNFNLAKGEPMISSDLFKEGSEDEIAGMLAEAFDNLEIAKTAEIALTDNFHFDAGGVTFIYQAGEIASDDEGIIRLFLSWKDLKKCLASR